MLGLCGVFSPIYHKTEKKLFKVLALASGIASSGIFVTSLLCNVGWLIKEILSYLCAGLVVRIYGLEILLMARHALPLFVLIATIATPIFILANLLGACGMILLAFYLVNPYKKGKKDAEAVECECTEHTECHCCGEGAECTCHEHTECTCCGEECDCAHETTEAEPQASEIADPINA